LGALVAYLKPPPRRKVYCASIKDFPIGHVLGAPLCLDMGIEVIERDWIATLELAPGIYDLDGDFLVIGPRASVEPVRVKPRREYGLTKLVYGKPNRMKRRAKGRKG